MSDAANGPMSPNNAMLMAMAPDRGARPAEFVLERHHEDGGRGAHPRRRQQDQKRDCGDDPGVVHSPVACWTG